MKIIPILLFGLREEQNRLVSGKLPSNDRSVVPSWDLGMLAVGGRVGNAGREESKWSDGGGCTGECGTGCQTFKI